ncbi:3-deoxy-manno-octulosonate cytidylyltransferase [Salinimonas marina]|uniref:3-deoxy-manno-octulosonate cytidylyltransferase n=1 Tax=Salinimonas marina TaxID=2785918 RepID=A0A7S9DW72_9ALTE|nr:3-deoxy-manno-octulosonate cytidylyltransferase [Salinimonas marina]QPG04360.1 3-deoxy-manno-octulosonate cytidylyltransferase [Salinimonas marina]
MGDPATTFTVIIPARYGSTRFPGKPLADIKGQPMIAHVIARAKEAGAERIVVATDDKRIATVAEQHCEVCLTRANHNSGTERLAEVVDILQLEDDIPIVNVQGDEPFVPAKNIRQVADNLASHTQLAMATLATPFTSAEDVLNPNMVKVVRNHLHHALYFSRSAIPFHRAAMLESSEQINPTDYLRHIGIYAYRAQYIGQYVRYAASMLENYESLEQLRALWYGDKIHVDIARETPEAGIDTPEDLARLLRVL